MKEALTALLTLAIVFGLFVAGVLAYFLPYIVANRRRHPQAEAIFILNLLAGWTFIGWVGAMVWACIQAAPLLPQPPSPAPRSRPPDDEEPPVYEIPSEPRRKR